MKKALFLLGLVFTCLHCYGQIDLTSGLVAYYPFDGNAIDESVNGNDGVVYGAMLTTDRCGRPDRAFSFNAVGDRVDCGYSPALDVCGVGAQWSVALWIKFTGNQYTGLIYKNDNGSVGWDVSVRYGEIVCRMQSVATYATNSFNYSTVNRFNDGQWHFVYLTFNAAAAAEGEAFTIRVDTVLQTIRRVAGYYSPGQEYNNSGPLIIGDHPLYEIDFFTGQVDDIRIYNRILTEAEIGALFIIDPCCSYAPVDQPLSFYRENGKPKLESFTWESCGGPGSLYILNQSVSSAEIYLNGELVLNPSDFNPNVSTIFVPVELLAGTNTITVILRSKPASSLQLEFLE